MNPQSAHRTSPGALWPAACALLILTACAAPLAAQPPPQAPDRIDLTGIWKFKGDWEESGQAQGWQQPDFDDSQWQSLQVPGSWEEQGIMTPNPRWPSTRLGDGYNGYAWYRLHVTVPPEWKETRATLRIRGINDYDWTYLNGRLVGASTSGAGPFTRREYPIPPDLLKPGEDNVIAIRVCDIGATGGIERGPVEITRLEAEQPQPAYPEPAPDQYTETRGEMVIVGEPVHVPANTRVDGSVVVVGGSADIQGYVTCDVVAWGGDIHARPGSKIGGDAVAWGGRVVRDPDAEIRGSTVSLPTMPAAVATLLGRATRDTPIARYPDWWPLIGAGYPRRVVSFLGSLVIWGLVAVLAVLVFPKRLETMALALPTYPGRAALCGAGGFLLTPAAVVAAVFAGLVVILILTVTVVGIALIPAVIAGVLAAILGILVFVVLGTSGVWLSLGKALATRLGRPEIHAAWAVLIGVLLVALLAALPLVGPFVVVTLEIFGFGVALMTGLGAHPDWIRGKSSRREPEAQPHEPPADEAPAAESATD